MKADGETPPNPGPKKKKNPSFGYLALFCCDMQLNSLSNLGTWFDLHMIFNG
jgi:hypothetical protein